MSNEQLAVSEKPDPLEPIKAVIRQHIAGKDLAKTSQFQAYHDLYLANVPTRLAFDQAWQAVMREIEPPKAVIAADATPEPPA